MRLNLGCGWNTKDNFTNIDITPYKGVNEIIDLRVYPWKWTDESIDEVYMGHFLEHLPNQDATLYECYRILKKGGKLVIVVPHCTNMRGLGDIGHYRGYSVKTFDRYLCQPYYWFPKPLFKQISKKIIYIRFGKCWWLNIIAFITLPVEWLINLCPEFFERLWWGYVGGASEVQWEGEKI